MFQSVGSQVIASDVFQLMVTVLSLPEMCFHRYWKLSHCLGRVSIGCDSCGIGWGCVSVAGGSCVIAVDLFHGLVAVMSLLGMCFS